MQYPGTSPAGYGFGRGGNPQDLEQRKQALLQQMTGSGGQGPGTLSFGGSTGDAAARQPGLSWNPFLAAQNALYGINNAGQQGNNAVSAQPFFGAQGGISGNVPGNGQQAAQVATQPALGDATQSTQSVQSGVSNPGFNTQAPSGAGRLDFGAGQFGPFSSTIQQLASYFASNPTFQAPVSSGVRGVSYA